LHRTSSDLSLVRDPIGLERSVNNLEKVLCPIINKLSEKGGSEVIGLHEQLCAESYVEDKIDLVNIVLSKLPRYINEGSLTDAIVQMRKEVLRELEQMNEKLDNINYNIFKLKIHSANAADSLRALKWELDKVKAIQSDVEGLGDKVEDLGLSQQQVLLELKSEMPRIIEELEELVKAREVDDKRCQDILNELQTLRNSPEETILNQAGNLTGIIGLVLTVLTL